MLTKTPKYIKEPDSLQCGQAVLAMLTDKTVDEIIKLTSVTKETKLRDMFFCLEACDIVFSRERKQVFSKTELPKIALLSLETPRCWHWSLYFKGRFFDPEHGESTDFPEANRKYFWEIFDLPSAK